MKAVALMLKAIHSRESKEAAREKELQVAETHEIDEGSQKGGGWH